MFQCFLSKQLKSVVTNGLVANILQNVFYVPQNKLIQVWNYPFKTVQHIQQTVLSFTILILIVINIKKI